MNGTAHDDGAALKFERATIFKVRHRCIPVLVLGFIICMIDRVNVGFAAITANKDLGLTASMYGTGAGLLFIGYSIFELPSNLALERFGARRWLARIMVTWGVLSGATAFVTGPWSFYAVRFLVGAAEAGFFPGVVLYLTYWFPKRYRASCIGLFAVGSPLASVIGSPISGLLLNMHGFLGFKGWQWLYFIEALPAVLLGIRIFLFFADKPGDARWLSAQQKAWLEDELEKERVQHPERSHIPPLHMFYDPRVLMLALIFFLTIVPSYGVVLWLPQIVRSFGLSYVETGVCLDIAAHFRLHRHHRLCKDIGLDAGARLAFGGDGVPGVRRPRIRRPAVVSGAPAARGLHRCARHLGPERSLACADQRIFRQQHCGRRHCSGQHAGSARRLCRALHGGRDHGGDRQLSHRPAGACGAVACRRHHSAALGQRLRP